MKKYFLAILVLVLLNCAKTDYYLKNVNHKVRLTSFTEEEGYKIKRRFELSHTRVNMFWGIVRGYNKDLDTILFAEFKNGDTEAVGNLVITETYDLLDSLADLFTLGTVRLYSVKISGDLYEKIPQPIEKKQEDSENLDINKDAIQENQVKDSKVNADEKAPKQKNKGKDNAKKK